MDELEKLDEQRRIVVMGIYDEKRRKKQLYNAHVKTIQFQKGDLVLLYNLKKHELKLKTRDLGTFIIKMN